MAMGYKPIGIENAKTYPIRERENKASTADFVKPEDALKFPRVFASEEFKEFACTIKKARKNGRPVLLGMGGHVVKCGMGLLVNDLIGRGLITGVLMNGAVSIHDYELARIGETSEDVAKNLPLGKFGMAKETGELNGVINACKGQEIGLGARIGRHISESKYKFKEYSILAKCWDTEIPATVHAGIGTEITIMHPSADGAALGEASFYDFRLLASELSELDGGVYMNVGSAVVLPEVFLKALNLARNITGKPTDFATADFDMNRQYRPHQNVVTRPTKRGYTFTGHHEILLPLLYHELVEGSGGEK